MDRQVSGDKSPRGFRRDGSFSSLPMSKHETGSKISPPPLYQDPDSGDDEDGPDQDHWLHMALKTIVLVMVVFGSPYVCRHTGLSSAARCVVVIMSVLMLNLAEVMPLFCTALFIPVLGTMCRVLGDGRSMVATSTLLVGNIFNNISFLVLGALVINGIFVKSNLERRLMNFLLEKFSADSKYFLLFLLLGGMAMCSVLYSGSLVLLSALRPVIEVVDGKKALAPPVAKRLMLAVAFCANAGSVWLPISSPVNLITVALLREFDHDVGLVEWVTVAIPVSTIAVLALWVALLYIYPDDSDSTESVNEEEEEVLKEWTNDDAAVDSKTTEKSRAVTFKEGGDEGTTSERSGATPSGKFQRHRALTQKEEEDELAASIELTNTHYFFLFVGVAALLGITVFMPAIEPILGHAACVSLCVVVMAFGSGFMTRDEFLQLDWDLLMLVGGTNVMAFLVRETGLGAELSSKLVSSEFFTMLPYWGFLVILIVGTVMISTTVGHTLTGVLLLPLIVALGLKLQAAETTALLCAIAIPFGMGLPQSSFDNSSAYTESRKYGRPRIALTQRDFRIPGLVVSVIAAVLLLFVGFGVCVFHYGLPPPVVVSEVSETPEKLKPKVVTENRPHEAKQVSYNKLMVNWKTFLDKPDEKAFAVGELKEGLKTRPWAASWNHETQKEANKAALEECERLADKCRLIWPQKGEEIGEASQDLRKAIKEDEERAEEAKKKQKSGATFLRARKFGRTSSEDLRAPAFPKVAVTCGHATKKSCA